MPNYQAKLFNEQPRSKADGVSTKKSRLASHTLIQFFSRQASGNSSSLIIIKLFAQ